MTLNVILYSDGSANPNPGNIGSACHGYIYEETTNEQFILYDNILTTKGYVRISDYEANKNILVNPTHFIEMSQSFNDSGTNNTAEIIAIKLCLEYIINNEFDINSVIIYSDSSYAVNLYNEYLEKWKKNSWIKSDGKLSLNIELLEEIHDLLLVARSKVNHLHITWIKGHDGNLGNVLADFSANIARDKSTRNVVRSITRTVNSDDYVSSKVDIHPLLCYKNMILGSVNEEGVYYLFGSDEDADTIGKPYNGSTYSIVCLKEPESIIEEIKSEYYESRNSTAYSILDLFKVKSKNYYGRIKNICYNSILNKSKNNRFILPDKEIIIDEINPPGLLIKAIEHYEFLHTVVSDIKSNKIMTIDLTSKFYSTELNKKGKPKLVLSKELLVGCKNFITDVKIKGCVIRLPLILGIDMPSRNILKRLENQSPIVKLAVWPRSGESFGYCIYIETTDSCSIWSNMSTAKIFLGGSNANSSMVNGDKVL